MNLSNEYLALKAQAKVGKPVLYPLTKALADEILSRPWDGRGPLPRHINKFKEIFNNNLFAPAAPEHVPFTLDWETDLLVYGWHRLKAFSCSNKKNVNAVFEFVKLEPLQFTPQNALDLLTLDPLAVNRKINHYKEKEYMRWMRRNSKTIAAILRIKVRGKDYRKKPTDSPLY